MIVDLMTLAAMGAAMAGKSGGSGGGLPTGGEPHQMLVTDKAGKAGWEDKLCWAESETVTVLPETEAQKAEDGSAFSVPPLANDLIAGEEYTVGWNGASYTCKGYILQVQGQDCVCLGNGYAFGGEDVDVPFFIVAIPAEIGAADGVGAVVMPFDGSDEIFVSISATTETIKPIDPENLAPGVAANRMLVTNAEGKAEWQERLAWTEEKYITVLPETTLDFVESTGSPGNGEHKLKEPVEYFPQNLEDCVVTWNGVVYKGSWAVMDYGGGDVMAQLQMQDSESPFQMMLIGSETMAQQFGGYGSILQMDSTEPATVEIKTGGEVVQKIQDKYLPDQSEIFIVNGRKNEYNSDVADKTYEEVLAAYNEGKLPVLVWHNSDTQATVLHLTEYVDETFYFQTDISHRANALTNRFYLYTALYNRGNFFVGDCRFMTYDGNAANRLGIQLTSPNGTKYKLTVSDDGTLTATAL